MMRRTHGLAGIALMAALTFAACTTTETAVQGTSDTQEIDETVQIANPFGDYDKIEAAEKAAGFTLLAPEEISSIYATRIYRAMAGKMIEVIYPNASDSNDEIRIRKARGSGDISGDYNQYADTMTIIVSGHQVESRGNAGRTNVAIWEDGGYAYSVTCDKGLSLGLLREIVEQVQ